MGAASHTGCYMWRGAEATHLFSHQFRSTSNTSSVKSSTSRFHQPLHREFLSGGDWDSLPVLSSVQPGLSWHTVGINIVRSDGCTYPGSLSYFQMPHFKYGALFPDTPCFMSV